MGTAQFWQSKVYVDIHGVCRRVLHQMRVNSSIMEIFTYIHQYIFTNNAKILLHGNI